MHAWDTPKSTSHINKMLQMVKRVCYTFTKACAENYELRVRLETR